MMFFKNKETLNLLDALRPECTSGKSLDISHVDFLVLYVLEPNNALL